MDLPFTPAEFFEVFRRYNEAVWPAQIALQLLAIIGLAAVLLKGRSARPIALSILALFWVWMAVAYHWAFFAAINPAAKLFAVVFAIGATGFLAAALRRNFAPAWPSPRNAIVGLSLIGYALVGYPIVGALAGHRFPAVPTFGLPCPTTIFTIGLLTFLVPPASRILLLIPVLWTAVGSMAAFGLGVPEDFGLAVAGLWGMFLLARRTPMAHAPLAGEQKHLAGTTGA